MQDFLRKLYFKETKRIITVSEWEYTVREIHFKPGDFIKKGQIILTLSNSIEKLKVEQKKAQIKTQQSRIKAAEAALSAVKIRAENARINFMRAQSLYKNNAENKNYFDKVKTEYEALLEETKRLGAELVAAKDLLSQERIDLDLACQELSLKSVEALSSGQILSLDCHAKDIQG